MPVPHAVHGERALGYKSGPTPKNEGWGTRKNGRPAGSRRYEKNLKSLRSPAERQRRDDLSYRAIPTLRKRREGRGTRKCRAEARRYVKTAERFLVAREERRASSAPRSSE